MPTQVERLVYVCGEKPNTCYPEGMMMGSQNIAVMGNVGKSSVQKYQSRSKRSIVLANKCLVYTVLKDLYDLSDFREN